MTVTEAVDALRAHGVGALVVSSDGQHIDGIVSERDIVRGLSGQLGALLTEPVRADHDVHGLHVLAR